MPSCYLHHWFTCTPSISIPLPKPTMAVPVKGDSPLPFLSDTATFPPATQHQPPTVPIEHPRLQLGLCIQRLDFPRHPEPDMRRSERGEMLSIYKVLIPERPAQATSCVCAYQKRPETQTLNPCPAPHPSFFLSLSLSLSLFPPRTDEHSLALYVSTPRPFLSFFFSLLAFWADDSIYIGPFLPPPPSPFPAGSSTSNAQHPPRPARPA